MKDTGWLDKLLSDFAIASYECNWVDEQLKLTSEVKQAILTKLEEREREAQLYLIDSTLEEVSHDDNPTTWALEAKLAQLSQKGKSDDQTE